MQGDRAVAALDTAVAARAAAIAKNLNLVGIANSVKHIKSGRAPPLG
jgi:hypothetical protein